MPSIRAFRLVTPIYQFTGKRISVIIVDNQLTTLAGIEILLSKLIDIQIVGKACDADEAIELTKSVNADVIIIDLTVPRSRSIKETFSALNRAGAKIIVFSSESRPAVIRMAMSNGASAFLSKTESFHRICEAIRDVDAGADGYLSGNLNDKDKHQLFSAEDAVLSLLARGMRYEEIADWRHTSVHTVRAQCMHIQKKLGVPNRESLIVWAVENGYGCTGEGGAS